MAGHNLNHCLKLISELSEQSKMLTQQSSLQLKFRAGLQDLSPPGRKQNFKNETKQSGPKSEYVVNHARSGALMASSQIVLKRPSGFYKL